MPHVHAPVWVLVIAAIPAAVIMRILLFWNPKSKRQWLIAGGMTAYALAYYIVFLR